MIPRILSRNRRKGGGGGILNLFVKIIHEIRYFTKIANEFEFHCIGWQPDIPFLRNGTTNRVERTSIDLLAET